MKQNFLEKIPSILPNLDWSKKDDGNIIILKRNIGFANHIMQFIFKKPKISYIHLESFGSFVWQNIDGKRNVFDIGLLLQQQFGKNAEPLYERLVQFLKTLQNNKFIVLI